MKEYQIPKPEKATCSNCIYNTKRADMKNIKYCIKRSFPIFDDGQCCTKYIRRVKDGKD